jgi:hypothetical protein
MHLHTVEHGPTLGLMRGPTSQPRSPRHGETAMGPVLSDYPAGVVMPQLVTANLPVAEPSRTSVLLRSPPPTGVTRQGARPVSVLAGVGMKIERHPPHTVLAVAHVEFVGPHEVHFSAAHRSLV